MPAIRERLGWAAARLPPGTRRALRRLLGARSPRPRAIAPPATTTEIARAASDAAALARPPFEPDGTGFDPRMNAIGPFRGEFGVAEAARSLVTAAQAGGVRVALVGAGAAHARGDDVTFADAIGTDAPHPVNVICVNANDTAQLMDELGPGVTAGRYNIGFWFWELAKFPAAWQGAVDRVDEIWVATEFVRATMAAVTTKPVRTVRLAVEATPSGTYRRSDFGLAEDAYTFLFTFSFNSYVARKNPLGVVNAFRKAFPDRDQRVALVLKSTNGHRAAAQLRRLAAAIDGDERIRMIDGSMPRDKVLGLENVVDSYVSLHRSEGFGLGLAESMLLAKPVIGTAYSGNLEFMDGSNSCLVDYRLTAVGEREYPFPDGQVWAEPDEDHAADLMRRLAGDPALGHGIGARAQAHMRQHFSAEAVGAGVAERLSGILDGRT